MIHGAAVLGLYFVAAYVGQYFFNKLTDYIFDELERSCYDHRANSIGWILFRFAYLLAPTGNGISDDTARVLARRAEGAVA